MEAILNFLVAFAARQLEEHGEFPPHAAALAGDGELRTVGIRDEQGVEPEAEELAVILREALRMEAKDGEIRACGIALDVLVNHPDTGDRIDAVAFELDHRDEDAVDVFLPYERSAKGYEFGEVFAAEPENPIFQPA